MKAPDRNFTARHDQFVAPELVFGDHLVDERGNAWEFGGLSGTRTQ